MQRAVHRIVACESYVVLGGPEKAAKHVSTLHSRILRQGGRPEGS